MHSYHDLVQSPRILRRMDSLDPRTWYCLELADQPNCTDTKWNIGSRICTHLEKERLRFIYPHHWHHGQDKTYFEIHHISSHTAWLRFYTGTWAPAMAVRFRPGSRAGIDWPYTTISTTQCTVTKHTSHKLHLDPLRQTRGKTSPINAGSYSTAIWSNSSHNRSMSAERIPRSVTSTAHTKQIPAHGMQAVAGSK